MVGRAVCESSSEGQSGGLMIESPEHWQAKGSTRRRKGKLSRKKKHPLSYSQSAVTMKVKERPTLEQAVQRH